MNASRSRAVRAAIMLLGLLTTCSACAVRVGDASQQSDCTGPYAVCKPEALQLTAPYDTHGPKDIEIWPHADVIIDDAAKRAQKDAMAGLVLKDGENTFRTTLDGQPYYMTANHYNVWPKNMPKNGPSAKDKGFCVFYLYGPNMDFATSYRTKVGVGDRLTMCNSVIGVSGVSLRGQPTLMAVVQYFYTGGPVAHTAAAIGADWIRTTVLLPLKQQPDGKWVFTQDTSCFPLTNTIATLAAAKKHLATCH